MWAQRPAARFGGPGWVAAHLPREALLRHLLEPGEGQHPALVVAHGDVEVAEAHQREVGAAQAVRLELLPHQREPGALVPSVLGLRHLEPPVGRLDRVDLVLPGEPLVADAPHLGRVLALGPSDADLQRLLHVGEDRRLELVGGVSVGVADDPVERPALVGECVEPGFQVRPRFAAPVVLGDAASRRLPLLALRVALAVEDPVGGAGLGDERLGRVDLSEGGLVHDVHEPAVLGPVAGAVAKPALGGLVDLRVPLVAQGVHRLLRLEEAAGRRKLLPQFLQHGAQRSRGEQPVLAAHGLRQGVRQQVAHTAGSGSAGPAGRCGAILNRAPPSSPFLPSAASVATLSAMLSSWA